MNILNSGSPKPLGINSFGIYSLFINLLDMIDKIMSFPFKVANSQWRLFLFPKKELENETLKFF